MIAESATLLRRRVQAWQPTHQPISLPDVATNGEAWGDDAEGLLLGEASASAFRNGGRPPKRRKPHTCIARP